MVLTPFFFFLLQILLAKSDVAGWGAFLKVGRPSAFFSIIVCSPFNLLDNVIPELCQQK